MASLSSELILGIVVLPGGGQPNCKFEVSGREIIRLKTGPGWRSVPWTPEDTEMVRHLLSLPHQHGDSLDARWAGRRIEAVIYPPKRCWVIRRKDGRVYQCHPEYAADFARQRLEELLEREGG